MFSCEVKQKVCGGITPTSVLELLYQKIPADNGFLLACEVGDDVLFILVREIRIALFLFDAYRLVVFLTKIGQQEEIHHFVFIRTKFSFGNIHFQNLLLGIFNGLFD